ncbi:MAG: hypothetical protein HQK75_02910 [Candidatus Magnetomorum sp.]|nr:hypothetical protein [Candidatus Magnetomorum sp.]
MKRWIAWPASGLILLLLFMGCGSMHTKKIDTPVKLTACHASLDISVLNKCTPKSSSCRFMPYHLDKPQTQELLNFILHGKKNARIVSQDFTQIKILVNPSRWLFTYSVDIFFDDDNRLIRVCTNNSRDWFNGADDFADQLYSNYLNVVRKG